MPDFDTLPARQRLGAMRHDWDKISADGMLRHVAEATTWSTRIQEMRHEIQAVKERGDWTRGPSDLLGVCQLDHWELAHSKALAWACDPEAPHGLGRVCLGLLIQISGLSDMDHREGVISVATEEWLSPTTRADIVIRSHGRWTLLIEVKVDALEQPEQCDRLVEFAPTGTRLGFLFVVPPGHRPPKTATRTGVNWVTVSWREIGRLFRPLLTTEPSRFNVGTMSGGSSGVTSVRQQNAQLALWQWLTTLGRLYGGTR